MSRNGTRRTDGLTPKIPAEARAKLDVLRVEMVRAFEAGDYERWAKLVRSARLVLRLAGIRTRTHHLRMSGLEQWKKK
jgi:hypothetical protein